MTDLEQHVALEAIRQLKARYFYCIDTQDWAGYEQVFTPDAVMDAREAVTAAHPANGTSTVFGKPELIAGWGGEDWLMKGAKTIVAGASAFLQEMSTVHHGYLPQIGLTGDDSATGIWAMDDLLRFPKGSPICEIRGFGHYHETYLRRDGHRLIATTRLTRLRLDVA
jgi:hypothetical protein